MAFSRFLLLPLAGLVLVAGCKDKKDTGDDGDIIEENPTYTLEFSIEAESASAGQAVAYLAELVASDGTRASAAVTLLDNLEAALDYDNSNLWPTLAGTHELTASATSPEGESLVAADSLLVIGGEPTSVDLILDDDAAMAGDEVGYEVLVTDLYGNVIDASAASITASSANLVIDAADVYSTVPGVYTITASAGAVSDQETLVVSPGYPDLVEIYLTDTSIEVNDTVTAYVTVYDAYGNETEDDWLLYVEASLGDPGSVTISYNNLTFTDEGSFFVVATVENPPGEIVEGRVGPLLVDSMGPDLFITEPARGTFSTSTTGRVAGTVTDLTSGVSSLTVNGNPVTVETDGTFSTSTTYVVGTNLVDSIAVDGDTNAVEDIRAVQTGAFQPYGLSVLNGFIVRLNQGGLDTLEAIGEGLLSSTDLSSMIPSPVFSDSYSIWGATVYSINLYASNARFSGQDLELDPMSSGYLRAIFTVYGPTIDWSASGRVLGGSVSGNGTIYATSISATMDLQPYVSGGNIYVNVASADVSSVGFTFDWDSWIFTIMDFFGIDLSSTIQGYMESSLESALTDEVPAIVEDALQDLELATAIPLMDNTYTLDAVPASIAIDDSGISLGLETYMTAASWVSPRLDAPGSLYSAYSAPSFGATPGMVMAVSEDFLNQALFAFWGGGLLDITMTDEEIGIDPSSLGFLFPGITEFTVVTQALLPPNLLPGTDDSLLDLELGDFMITLYGGPVKPGSELLQAYVHVYAGLDVEMSDTVLSATLNDPVVYFDVVLPEANTLAASDTEALLSTIVPMFLPTLTDALSEIPIPAISGFSFSGITISLAGAENGYLSLGGDLVVE